MKNPVLSIVFLFTLLTLASCGKDEPSEREKPFEKVNMIIDADLGNCTDDLLALQAAFAFQSKGWCEIKGFTLSEYLRSLDETISPAFDWETGQNPLLIQPIEMLEIKHGKRGITDKIADTIVKKFPYVNRDWLVSGNGDWMLTESQQLMRMESGKSQAVLTLEERISVLSRQVSELSEKIDRLLVKM